MTIQVGMIGSDGIVLASDTKWMFTPHSMEPTIRHTQSSSKIKISDDCNVAISCARNMDTSFAMADHIIAEMSDEDWLNPILPIEAIARQVLAASERRDVQLLIATSKCGKPSLFQLQIGTLGGIPNSPLVRSISDKAIVGDDMNPAIFWAERYYQVRTVKELARLCAQVVICATRFNTATIDGFEAIVCDGSGVRRFTEEENQGLAVAASALDRNVLTSLYVT